MQEHFMKNTFNKTITVGSILILSDSANKITETCGGTEVKEMEITQVAVAQELTES